MYGFKQWKEEGFSVRKGEKAIEILIPSIGKYYKDKEGKLVPVSAADPLTKERIQNKEIPVMKQVAISTKGHVFDITQTNAEEKDYPAYCQNGLHLNLMERALKHSTKHWKDMPGDCPIPFVSTYPNRGQRLLRGRNT